MPERARDGLANPAMKKVCVFGAGAIGGLIAARLALSGTPVSIVARGAHLAAIERRGLTLREGAREQVVRLQASADATAFGPQDYVIVAVKAHALAPALPAIAPLLGPQTVVVPAMNGVPWWFFDRFGGALEDMRLEGVDPGGVIGTRIGVERVLGCVVYLTACLPGAGIVEHTGRWDLYLGEPDGALSSRGGWLNERLIEAGFASRVSSNIRGEIWNKLIGNAALNPVSALSCAPLDQILDDPDVYALLVSAMNEVMAVGAALGLPSVRNAVGRLEMGRGLGSVKVSMLQDIEQGRPLEYEALCGTVVAIGARLGLATPMLSAVLGLIRLRARHHATAA
jgi:2-dehydropantoate 2-reductase